MTTISSPGFTERPERNRSPMGKGRLGLRIATSALGSDFTTVASPTSGILTAEQPLTTWLPVTIKPPSPIAKPDPDETVSENAVAERITTVAAPNSMAKQLDRICNCPKLAHFVS